MQLKFITLFFLFSQIQTQSDVGSKLIEVGINSIYKNKDGIVIDIYGFNTTPIAGIQLDIMNQGLFTIDSAYGGRCLENNFTIYTNKQGRILAFSMKGDLIPVSISEEKADNLLFSVYGKLNDNLHIRWESDHSLGLKTINMESIIAGKKGERLSSISPSFIWEGVK